MLRNVDRPTGGESALVCVWANRRGREFAIGKIFFLAGR